MYKYECYTHTHAQMFFWFFFYLFSKERIETGQITPFCKSVFFTLEFLKRLISQSPSQIYSKHIRTIPLQPKVVVVVVSWCFHIQGEVKKQKKNKQGFRGAKTSDRYWCFSWHQKSPDSCLCVMPQGASSETLERARSKEFSFGLADKLTSWKTELSGDGCFFFKLCLLLSTLWLLEKQIDSTFQQPDLRRKVL